MNISIRSPTSWTSIAVTACITLSGCGQRTGGDNSPITAATAESHEHPSEGPHHGSLIELGNGEYHGELVHDEQAGAITVYLLDSVAKQSVPIDAKDVTVNLSHKGRAEQFRLAANPDVDDPPGTSSRFISSSAKLAEELDHEQAEVQLVATINGKQYRGTVTHHHDHEGHDHDHE